MDDHNNQSPSSSSSSSSTAVTRRHRRHAAEEDCVDPVECTGRSCRSCTAGLIGGCVAVCCCPLAVVNILTLAFFKLPCAVARRCIARRKKKSLRRRTAVEENKRKVGDGNGVSGNGRAEDGISEIVLSCEVVNDDFSAELKAAEFWLELYEVGHLGFGRVSFTGIPFHNKGN